MRLKSSAHSPKQSMVDHACKMLASLGIFIPVVIISALISPEPTFADKASPHCVVLLHGLARSARSMKKMENALGREGFIVENVDYPSRKYDVDDLSRRAVAEGFRRCALHTSKPASFVTHSLGGILLRYYLDKNPDIAVGRVVMLAPPNQGSQVVDRLKDVPGFNAFHGPVGRRLGTAKTDLPRSLGEVGFDLGVIAGTRSINPLLSQLLPNPDDGKVSAVNTRVDGMCDFIRLPLSHALMMRSPLLIEHTVSFLQSGKFLHDTPSDDRCD